MCFSCRYSSVVSLSSSRHGLIPRRTYAIYRSLAFRTSRPVSPPLLDSSIMTVRGMRRIQASKSAALRCLVIGPSFFDPSKYTVGIKEEGAAAVDARRRTWLATHGSLGHVSPQSWRRKLGGGKERERKRERKNGKKARRFADASTWHSWLETSFDVHSGQLFEAVCFQRADRIRPPQWPVMQAA